MPTDWSVLEEVNPELKERLEERPPQTPYEAMTAQYPALMEFLANLGLPTGGAGLFNSSFRHSRIDTGGDDDLAFFDEQALANMPRTSGLGQAQIADKRGRMHDVFKIQRKLDKAKGIEYSADTNPYAANKLMGG